MGPIARNKAWFLDGFETAYDNNIIIAGLPSNANSNQLWRGSNLVKAQVNVTPRDSVVGGLLFNGYHSPYDGLYSDAAREHDQSRYYPRLISLSARPAPFRGRRDLGVGIVHFRDGYEPHGDIPFEVSSGSYLGSFYEALTGVSRRVEGTAALYLPPLQWVGRRDLKIGLDSPPSLPASARHAIAGSPNGAALPLTPAFGTILRAAEADDLVPDNSVLKTRLPPRGPISEKAPIAPERTLELLEALPEPSHTLA